jgi:deazaflavin-dependent oxidoreductase (nitroreductase family)
MQLPRSLARFNRRVTNHVFAPLAGRIPPWAVVEHMGRRSRRRYRTVLMAFPRGQDMVIALTYGPSADWVRNVLSAGGCRIKWRGHWQRYQHAEVISGAAGAALLPPGLRTLSNVFGLPAVLYLRGRPLCQGLGLVAVTAVACQRW